MNLRSGGFPTGTAGGNFMLERLEQQQKLTTNQWKIVATANLGDLLDFFDFYLVGYALSFIVKEWQLTYGESALILLASGVGAVPGAFFWGWMADKIGRRKVFMLTAVNVALATGVLALTPGQGGFVAGWLFIAFFRFFVGVGNAGLYAVDLPLVQEFVPGHKRGWISALTTTMLPAGSLLGALCDRAGADRPGSDDPRLGARIAALADAHGPPRGGAQIACVGADG
jgi:MFS transporter, putative metabolite:H+ symporter